MAYNEFGIKCGSSMKELGDGIDIYSQWGKWTISIYIL